MVYIAKSSKIVILGQPAAAIRVWTTSGHRSYYWQQIARDLSLGQCADSVNRRDRPSGLDPPQLKRQPLVNVCVSMYFALGYARLNHNWLRQMSGIFGWSNPS